MTDKIKEIFVGKSLVIGDSIRIIRHKDTKAYGIFISHQTAPSDMVVLAPETVGEMLDALDKDIIKECMRRTREGEE